MGQTPFRAATIDQSQPGPPHLCDGPIRATTPNSNSLFFFFLSFLFLSFFSSHLSFRPSFCPFLFFIFFFFLFYYFLNSFFHFFIFILLLLLFFFFILHLLSFFHFGIRLAFTHSLTLLLLFYYHFIFYSSGLHRGLAQSFLFIQSTSPRTISIPSSPLSVCYNILR